MNVTWESSSGNNVGRQLLCRIIDNTLKNELFNIFRGTSKPPLYK